MISGYQIRGPGGVAIGGVDAAGVVHCDAAAGPGISRTITERVGDAKHGEIAQAARADALADEPVQGVLDGLR